MWSLPIRQPSKNSGTSFERPVQVENDTLILSTDANPSLGLSRVSVLSGFFCWAKGLTLWTPHKIATRTTKTDVAIATRIPGTTIGAAPFFQRTAILHVMTNALQVLEPGMLVVSILI